MKLPQEKLDLLRKAFIEEAMSPGTAAKRVGISGATANRYFEKWIDDITKAREQQLVPQLKRSIQKFTAPLKGKKRRGGKA